MANAKATQVPAPRLWDEPEDHVECASDAAAERTDMPNVEPYAELDGESEEESRPAPQLRIAPPPSSDAQAGDRPVKAKARRGRRANGRRANGREEPGSAEARGLLPRFDEVLQKVSIEGRETLYDLVALIDAFCKKHLNEEYADVCRVMAAAMCAEDCKVRRGKLEGWACGIVYAVGWVNFLCDPNNDPHMRADDICKAFGVSPATMHNRFRGLKDAFDLMPIDPLWWLPSKLPKHPMIYMMELENGMIVDARQLPRHL